MTNWAVKEMKGAVVPHGRALTNLALITDRLAENPGVSFSAATGHGGRQAASRLFSNPKTTSSGLLQGHCDQTCARSWHHNLVLVAQDTTVIDYSGHVATQGLGPINHAKSMRGLHAHSAFVMKPDGSPLGVAHLDIWSRELEKKGSAANRRAKPIEEKESNKWLKGLDGIEECLGLHLSLGRRVLVIQDREADIFDFVAHPRHPGIDLLIRAAHPRLVEVEGHGAPMDLFKAALQAQVMGDYVVTIPRKANAIKGEPGLPQREATLELRSQMVTMREPTHGAKRTIIQPQNVWVVDARENSQSKDAVAWTLITTLPVDTAEAAKQIVEYYTRRWLIERLHFTLKSGLQIERLQFDDAHSLTNALAVCWIVAWRIMFLTYTARVNPTEPARYVLEPDEITVLEQMEGKSVTTVQQAVLAIAKLAGYHPSPKALPPGLKVMWNGMRKLDAMVTFYEAIAHRISRMQNTNQD